MEDLKINSTRFYKNRRGIRMMSVKNAGTVSVKKKLGHEAAI